jgi:hypothetical protein
MTDAESPCPGCHVSGVCRGELLLGYITCSLAMLPFLSTAFCVWTVLLFLMGRKWFLVPIVVAGLVSYVLLSRSIRTYLDFVFTDTFPALWNVTLQVTTTRCWRRFVFDPFCVTLLHLRC